MRTTGREATTNSFSVTGLYCKHSKSKQCDKYAAIVVPPFTAKTRKSLNHRPVLAITTVLLEPADIDFSQLQDRTLCFKCNSVEHITEELYEYNKKNNNQLNLKVTQISLSPHGTDVLHVMAT